MRVSYSLLGPSQNNADVSGVPLVASPEFLEGGAALSPDGRRLACTSDEAGDIEVFVRPFPNVAESRWLVSTAVEPSRSGHRVVRSFFTRTRPLRWWRWRSSLGPTFATGEHRVLFEWGNLDNDRWDVAPGAQRFVFVRFRRIDEDTSRLILVQNWFTELRERMGGS